MFWLNACGTPTTMPWYQPCGPVVVMADSSWPLLTRAGGRRVRQSGSRTARGQVQSWNPQGDDVGNQYAGP